MGPTLFVILATTVRFCEDVVKKLKDLPEDHRVLVVDAESLAKKLKWTSNFVKLREEKLDGTHKKELKQRCDECTITLLMVETLARRDGGVLRELIGSKDVATLGNDLRKHRDDVDSIIGRTILHIVAQIESNLYILSRDNRRPIGHPPVNTIPDVTPEFARQLLKSGENVDSVEPGTGRTPLHAALYKGQQELAALLLKNYADPAAATQNAGHTAVHIAAGFLPGMLPSLRESIVGQKPTNLQDTQNQSMRVRYDVRKDEWKRLLQSEDKSGQTPLHAAVENLSCEGVRYLCKELKVAKVPDVIGARDNYGQTPLHVLAALKLLRKENNVSKENRENAITIAKLLIGSHPNALDVLDKTGYTPVQLAEKKGNEVVTKELGGTTKKDATTNEDKDQKNKKKDKVEGTGADEKKERKKQRGKDDVKERDNKNEKKEGDTDGEAGKDKHKRMIKRGV